MMRTYEQGAGRPDRIEVEAYGITVCSLSAADLHDAADARLIAAAPELLRATLVTVSVLTRPETVKSADGVVVSNVTVSP